MLFHISDILSITTGRLVSNRHIEGLYAILNHMTGEDLMTHQLPRASIACKPALEDAYPQLSAKDPIVAHEMEILAYTMATHPDDVKYAILGCISTIMAKHDIPEMLEVEALKLGQYQPANPITELEAMIGKYRVVQAEI